MEKNRKLDDAAQQLQLFNLHLEEKVKERTAELEEALRQLQDSQQQVLQEERMRALGLMASGVAHDFNNALSVVLGFGELVLENICRVPGLEESADFMKNITTAAMDGAQMVTRLREFHRPPESAEVRMPVEINTIVNQAISLTKPRWKNQSEGSGKPIHVRAELQKLAPVIGDASELRETLTNLIFNAVDAMPLGGTITLRTHAEGDWIVIEVSDTGSGMTDEVRQHCIDPFFTTKGEHGSGLGLAMVYGIVERHGGTIDIKTALGQGTTFILRLPATKEELIAPSSSEAVVPASRTILVVDDQPVFLEALSQSLELDDHVVERATDGREALEKFNAKRFDLVITDQAMPHLNGDQLANAITEIRPSQPVIMLTGFGSAAGERSGAIDVVLGKPAPMDVLRHAMARVMSSDEPVEL